MIKTVDPRDALNRTIEQFNLKAGDLADAAGISPQALSRYRHKHQDFLSLKLHSILSALPDDARLYFASLLGSRSAAEQSGSYDLSPVKPSSFAVWLWSWLAKNGMSPQEAQDKLEALVALNPKDFAEILAGRQPNDTELGKIGTVFLDGNIPYSLEKLQAIRNGKGVENA